MRMLKVLSGEEGHAGPIPGALLAAAGAIMLGIGAANATGWLSIVGGIVLAVGILGTLVLNHMTVEYDMYARLEVLEKPRRGARDPVAPPTGCARPRSQPRSTGCARCPAGQAMASGRPA